MIVSALKWFGDIDGFLELVDQRKLPGEFIKLHIKDVEQVYDAIKTLTVRGAPAIGVCAAYGLVVAIQKLPSNTDLQTAMEVLKKACDYLGSSRPTAVNLFWALDRVRRSAESFIAKRPGADLREFQEAVLNEANAICLEDMEMCRRIGQNGQRFIANGAGILTHCNAGALATAGQGTALSVLFEAHNGGKRFKVYADETRPLLQGARLTSWELKQAGIDVTVLCDNMAGWLMKQGRVDAVITGADRIAANGDTANKIGTYSLSLLAREHRIPFYVAAPSSTFDLNIRSGDEIPIEERHADEVTKVSQTQIAPVGVKVYNPAFDVTEAGDIAAIITERGVIEKPTSKKIAEHFK